MKISSKHILITSSVVVFIVRCIYRWYFPNLYTDTLLLLEVSGNYLNEGLMVHAPIEGSGLSGPWVPLTVMPRGYVYFLTWLAPLIPQETIRVFVGDCLSLSILIFASLNLIHSLIPDKYFPQFLFLGFLGLFPGFLHPLPATDLMSLAFLSLSLSFMFGSQNNPTLFRLGVSSLCLCLTASLRYAYLPFLGALPLCFAWALWANSRLKSEWKKLAFFSLMPLILGIYVNPPNKDLPFVSNQSHQIYWEHLLHTDFFPVKSLIYFNSHHLELLTQNLSLGRGISNVLMISLSALLLLISWKTWYAWGKIKGILQKFAIFFSGIFFSNIALLVYLSLKTPPETDWLPFWTFVMETRYYAPAQYVMVLTLIYLTSRSNIIFTESQARWPFFRA